MTDIVDDKCPCIFCGGVWGQQLRLFCGANQLAALPVCNAHAAAMQLGEWTLSVRCMDMERAVYGGGER